jgi:hypothetical protein
MASPTDAVRPPVETPLDAAGKARDALLNKIDRLAGAANNPSAVLQLAEAYAYVVNAASARGPTVKDGTP